MKVASNTEASSYLIKLSSDEAYEFHEFLSKHARGRDSLGIPALEVRIANGLFEEGLSKRYHDKWEKEYGIRG
jgi:hypothetical protein